MIRLDRFDLRDGAVLVASTDGTQAQADRSPRGSAIVPESPVRHRQRFDRSRFSARWPERPRSRRDRWRSRRRRAFAGIRPTSRSTASCWAERSRRAATSTVNISTAADALVAIAIPRTELGGYGWGPLRVDGVARPGAIPKLDLLLAIPGLELTAKGGQGGGTGRLQARARLALEDLSRTGKAVQVLTASVVPSMAGHGDLRLTVEGPLAGAPGSLTAGCKGLFDHLRFAENTITDLSIDGHAAQLAKIPGEADLTVTVASVVAGTTKLGKIELGAKVRQQAISLSASLASPEPIRLALAGQIDGDRQGLALSRLSLSYPKSEWVSEGTAHLRLEAQKLSLADLRLRAQGQQLAVDGSKDDERVDAHVALTKFRLDLLPTLVGPARPESGRDCRPRRQGQRRGEQSQGGRAAAAGTGTLPDLLEDRRLDRRHAGRPADGRNLERPCALHGDERRLSPAGRARSREAPSICASPSSASTWPRHSVAQG